MESVKLKAKKAVRFAGGSTSPASVNHVSASSTDLMPIINQLKVIDETLDKMSCDRQPAHPVTSPTSTLSDTLRQSWRSTNSSGQSPLWNIDQPAGRGSNRPPWHNNRFRARCFNQRSGQRFNQTTPPSTPPSSPTLTSSANQLDHLVGIHVSVLVCLRIDLVSGWCQGSLSFTSYCVITARLWERY